MVALLPRLAYSSVLTVLNCACYGLNKLYTASTGYTGNHKPSGHSSALAALGSLQPGPRVHDFPYIPRTQCITVIYASGFSLDKPVGLFCTPMSTVFPVSTEYR